MIVYHPVNGILTQIQNHQDWPDLYANWMARNLRDRMARPFPYTADVALRFLWQKQRAQELIDQIACYTRFDNIGVCHSNGADLYCRVLRETMLAFREIHFFAPACEPDCNLNGINKAVGEGRLGAIYFYGSRSDPALSAAHWTAPVLRFIGASNVAYGDAGLHGFESMSPQTRAILRETWIDEARHSWFDPLHFEASCRLTVHANPQQLAGVAA